MLALALAITALAGCSTQVKVSEIDVALAADSVVNGIPFRVPGHFNLKLYQLVDGTYKKVEVTPAVETMADMSKLYLLKVEGQPLSQGSVTLKLTVDGLVDTLKVVSTSKGQDLLSELGSGIKKVAEAEATRDKADATRLTAAEADLAGSEDRTLAALQARQEADLAALELEALPATATTVMRKSAEQKLERLRLLANQKARRARLQPPFEGD